MEGQLEDEGRQRDCTATAAPAFCGHQNLSAACGASPAPATHRQTLTPPTRFPAAVVELLSLSSNPNHHDAFLLPRFRLARSYLRGKHLVSCLWFPLLYFFFEIAGLADSFLYEPLSPCYVRTRRTCTPNHAAPKPSAFSICSSVQQIDQQFSSRSFCLSYIRHSRPFDPREFFTDDLAPEYPFVELQPISKPQYIRLPIETRRKRAN